MRPPADGPLLRSDHRPRQAHGAGRRPRCPGADHLAGVAQSRHRTRTATDLSIRCVTSLAPIITTATAPAPPPGRWPAGGPAPRNPLDHRDVRQPDRPAASAGDAVGDDPPTVCHGSSAPIPAAELSPRTTSWIEATMARRIVGRPFDGAPDDNGLYGAGRARRSSWSSSATARRPAWVRTSRCRPSAPSSPTASPRSAAGRSGSPTSPSSARSPATWTSSWPTRSTRCRAPDVAVVIIGANDVTHRIDKSVAVATWPRRSVGCATPAPRSSSAPAPTWARSSRSPSRCGSLARRWSRDLAAAQTVAVVEAGGRTVSLGDLLGPEFDERPHEMFSSDRFHPSAAGYARAAAALLPSVCAALGPLGRRGPSRARPRPRRGHRAGRRRRGAGRRATPAPRSARPQSAARRAVRAGAGPSCAGGRTSPSPPARRAATVRRAPRRERGSPRAEPPSRRVDGRDQAHTRSDLTPQYHRPWQCD